MATAYGRPRPGLEALLADPPKIHAHEGKIVLWGLPTPVLEFLDRNVSQSSRTLETGAGLSTILFALKASTHTCVTPSPEEVTRIRNYCKEKNIPDKSVDFHLGFSTNVLPKLAAIELDLALIDGGHGFPTVFMDWYYISSWLKIGGLLIIDDLQIWTGGILKEFVNAEREWELIEIFENKTAVFVKKEEYLPWKDFGGQPYVIQQSQQGGTPESKLRKGLRLMRRGQFVALAKKAGNYVLRGRPGARTP